MRSVCSKALAVMFAALVSSGLCALPAMAAAPAVAAEAPAVPAPEVLFARRCGICHNPGGFGAQTLGRRLGPERAVLATRRDLTVPFVTVVVRHGLLNMPRLTRVEVTDEELVAIATWLARPREEQTP